MNAVRRSALVFPGQGYQKPGMLKLLHRSYPALVNDLLNQLDSSISQSLSSALLDESTAIDVNNTSNAQPLLLTASYAYYKAYVDSVEVKNHVTHVLGHSLGEYTALVAANVLSFSAAVKLVRQRGLAMLNATANIPNLSMITVLSTSSNCGQVSESIIRLIPMYDKVSIANFNTPTQITLSGDNSQISSLVAQLNSSLKPRIRSRRLNVSGPFHSLYMAPAAETVRSVLTEISLSWPPLYQVVSNLTAQCFGSAEELRNNLVLSMVRPVQWVDSLRYLENKIDTALAVGPGDIGKLCSGYAFTVDRLFNDYD